MKMTLEDSPYRPKPSTLGKYGPNVLREVDYVSKGSSSKPFVSVKQRKNGQYVVVEKIPTSNFNRRHKFATVQQSLEETGVNFRSIKPSWKYSAKNPHVGHYQPGKARSLPPIDLGWKKEARTDSLSNAEHEPGGGNILIPKKKINWNVKSKIGSLDNMDYNRARTSQSDPTVGRYEPSPRYGALANVGPAGGSMHYTPGGAQVFKKSKMYENVSAKVGSLGNIEHSPRGGDITIHNKKLRWRRESKVGSLDNISHQPQGGDIYIMNQRLSWQAKPKIGSLDNVTHHPQTTVGRIPRYSTDWREKPRVGSLDNIHHIPGGGNIIITNRRLRWKAESKVNSLPTHRRSTGDLTNSSDEYDCKFR